MEIKHAYETIVIGGGAAGTVAGNTAADEYLPAPFRRRKEPLQDEDFPAPEGSGAFAAKETNETEADP